MSLEKVAKPLKIIFNKSLAQGKYPSSCHIQKREIPLYPLITDQNPL